MLRGVLRDAVWLNAHALPHDPATLEARVAEGYGARWAIDEGAPLAFRGFLEPHAKDGHERRWRH